MSRLRLFYGKGFFEVNVSDFYKKPGWRICLDVSTNTSKDIS